MEYVKIAVNRKEVCNMANKKRILSAALAVSVLFVVLYSVIFIAAQSHHDCIGENCPICLQIQNCENTLKTLSSAAAVTAVSAIFYVAFFIIRTYNTRPFVSSTPISLKVELSN